MILDFKLLSHPALHFLFHLAFEVLRGKRCRIGGITGTFSRTIENICIVKEDGLNGSFFVSIICKVNINSQ